AKRLWGRPAGWLAAGIWVTTQGVQYLGSFATYDAMSLMLITVAAWMVVRFGSASRVPNAIYLAAPVMLLANATKYASALYDLVVIALAYFVVAYFHAWRAALRVSATLLSFMIIGITAGLALAPPSYLAGITSTTLTRPPSTAPVSRVLFTSWTWVGCIAVLAVIALLSAVALHRRQLTDGQDPDRRRATALSGVLAVGAAAVLLAPLNQARIHTETSLSKHVTFGAWFAAMAAGWLFSNLIRRDGRNSWLRLSTAGVAVLAAGGALVPLGVAGKHQADRLDNEWSNSTLVVNALRPLVAHSTKPVLMDQSEIPAYYLENDLTLPNWVNTYYYAYTPPGTSDNLVGSAAYTAAVDNGEFSVIALDYGTQHKVDHAVQAAVHASGRYRWVGNYTSTDKFGRDTYVVWKLK
ncbi:MAG TPA: hypothetical protein VKI19_11115, partial [Acidimicrobiales bacterium]|nr:hypothetical protein [Acidimicrobiales bacterium]